MPGTIGETKAAIEAQGGRAIAVQADLTDVADLRRLVNQAVNALGHIDILADDAPPELSGFIVVSAKSARSTDRTFAHCFVPTAAARRSTRTHQRKA
jgi:NAD(P)-dependent dehydrogenase (short-subunit alcohol dehydrogenase family)